MKKILAIMITLAAAHAASSQDTTVYLPAFEPGQIWTEVRSYPPQEYHPSSAIITMDSSLTERDSLRYYTFRLRETTYNAYFSGRGYGLNYMRQSENHGKVYLVDVNSSIDVDFSRERLVYDMELNVGDTFEARVRALYDGEYALVVDSVFTQGGRKHIRFEGTHSHGIETDEHFPYFDDPLEFVEGIGPNWGWLWHDYDADWPAAMLCLWRDGEQLNDRLNGIVETYYEYFDGGEWDCTMSEPIGAVPELNQVDYKVYPNPVASTLTVAGLPEGRVTVTVYDLFGSRLMSVEDLGPNMKVDVSHIASRMLLVNVVSDSGCSTYKVMKL